MTRTAVHSSVWQPAPSASYPTLQGDLKVDVAIVGAGITGLTAALLLKRAGLRVAVVEQGAIGAGTTGYTTGRAQVREVFAYWPALIAKSAVQSKVDVME